MWSVQVSTHRHHHVSHDLTLWPRHCILPRDPPTPTPRGLSAANAFADTHQIQRPKEGEKKKRKPGCWHRVGVRARGTSVGAAPARLSSRWDD